MRLIILCIMSFLSFMSCTKDIDTSTEELPQEQTESTISINCTSAFSIESKSINSSDETNIDNLNIFCYSEKLGIFKHQYITGTQTDIMLLNSLWEVYIIANIGKSLSGLSLSEVENYTFSISAEDDLNDGGGLVMSYYENLNITSDCNLSITLERIVAKVNVNIDIALDMEGIIKIDSIKVINAPSTCLLFSPNSPTSQMQEYIKYCDEDGGSFNFYILENLQGENSDISQPEDKIGSKAPTNATYIQISAQSPTAEIEYRIYLGENTITNFDINRNREYNIDITIDGTNTSDLRVTLKSFALECDMLSSFSKELDYYDTTTSSFIVNSEEDINVSIDFKLTSELLLGEFYEITLKELDTSNTVFTFVFTSDNLFEMLSQGTIKTNTKYILYLKNVAKESGCFFNIYFNYSLPNSTYTTAGVFNSAQRS